jgi:hypothetical protein
MLFVLILHAIHTFDWNIMFYCIGIKRGKVRVQIYILPESLVHSLESCGRASPDVIFLIIRYGSWCSQPQVEGIGTSF